jgi:hypothetical protein
MSKTDEVILEGGCLCGSVRYRIVGTSKSIGHCHCESCQKASGAPFVTSRSRWSFVVDARRIG